jgi:hypothetical protein
MHETLQAVLRWSQDKKPVLLHAQRGHKHIPKSQIIRIDRNLDIGAAFLDFHRSDQLSRFIADLNGKGMKRHDRGIREDRRGERVTRNVETLPNQIAVGGEHLRDKSCERSVRARLGLVKSAMSIGTRCVASRGASALAGQAAPER